MGQQQDLAGKTLVFKPDGLSVNPGRHVMEGGSLLSWVVF